MLPSQAQREQVLCEPDNFACLIGFVPLVISIAQTLPQVRGGR
jgi:hypothetical protein